MSLTKNTYLTKVMALLIAGSLLGPTIACTHNRVPIVRNLITLSREKVKFSGLDEETIIINNDQRQQLTITLALDGSEAYAAYFNKDSGTNTITSTDANITLYLKPLVDGQGDDKPYKLTITASNKLGKVENTVATITIDKEVVVTPSVREEDTVIEGVIAPEEVVVDKLVETEKSKVEEKVVEEETSSPRYADLMQTMMDKFFFFEGNATTELEGIMSNIADTQCIALEEPTTNSKPTTLTKLQRKRLEALIKSEVNIEAFKSFILIHYYHLNCSGLLTTEDSLKFLDAQTQEDRNNLWNGVPPSIQDYKKLIPLIIENWVNKTNKRLASTTTPNIVSSSDYQKNLTDTLTETIVETIASRNEAKERWLVPVAAAAIGGATVAIGAATVAGADPEIITKLLNYLSLSIIITAFVADAQRQRIA